MKDHDELFLPHLGWLAHEPADDVATFLREGHFEAIEQAFFWLFLRPGNTFLDCGAHVGLFSIVAGHALERQGKILCLEPNPATAALLKKNLESHQICDAEVIEAAAWSKETRLKFTTEAHGKAAYARVTDTGAQGEIDVATVTLTNLLQNRGLARVDLAKIDTEGAELEVLSGAAGAIAERRLPLLMVEFTEQNLQRSGASTKVLFDRLQQLGYTLHRFDPETLQLTPASYQGEIWYENLFAAVEPDKVNNILKTAAPERLRIARDIIERAKAVNALRRESELRKEAEERVRRGSEALKQRETELRAANQTVAALSEKLKAAKRQPWIRVGRKLGLVGRSYFEKIPSAGTPCVTPQPAPPSSSPMQLVLQHLVEKNFSPNVILDVGAARGCWSEMASHYFPTSEFFLLEPLSANESRLKELSARHPRIKHLRCAAGEKPGESLINVTPDLDGSSLLSFGRDRQPEDEVVQIVTIDSLLQSGRVKPPQFVKMDVQGYELKALEGGKDLFKTAEVFILETSFYEFMPGCPLVHEVVAYMAARDFIVFDLAGFLRRPHENDLAQIDLVFVRKTNPMVGSNRWA